MSEPSSVTRVRGAALTLCALAGVVAAWNARYDLNPDGLSYLDIADALQRGRWSAALNGYWNPLYPALLAFFTRPATISPAWEFAAAHLFNLVVYLAALCCFDLLLRRLALTGSWRLVGYATFLWASAGLIRLDVVTPDLLMTLCLSLAFVLFLRARERDGGRKRPPFVVVGAVLGVGYLAKTVMLPVTVLFLVSLCLMSLTRSRLLVVFSIAIGFLLVAAPYVIALSIDRGRFTIGESGRLNVAWKPGGMTPFFFPQPREAEGLSHPPRRLCENPPAFEFGGQMPVTYPPWYDPSYWYEGVTPRITRAGELAVLRNSGVTAYLLLRQAWPVAALLALMLWLPPRDRTRRPNRDLLAIFLTCALALALYVPVEFSVRLAAPFIPPLVVTAVLLCGRRDAEPRWFPPAAAIAAILLAGLVVEPVAARTIDEVSLIRRGTPTNEHLEVATELTRLGLGPGDTVAVIGEGYGSYWARLARARIVAEAPDADRFWRAAPDDRRRCLEQLRSTGARMLVTFHARRDGSAAWQAVGSTGYDALVFK